MTVAQATDLRKTLRKNGAALKVVKNRLALRALPGRHARRPQGGLPQADGRGLHRRPTRSCVAKTLKDFAVQNKVLVLKGGVVQGRAFGAERFDEITKLGSREALLGKIGAMMASPLSTLLRTLQAPLANMGQPDESVKR